MESFFTINLLFFNLFREVTFHFIFLFIIFSSTQIDRVKIGGLVKAVILFIGAVFALYRVCLIHSDTLLSAPPHLVRTTDSPFFMLSQSVQADAASSPGDVQIIDFPIIINSHGLAKYS